MATTDTKKNKKDVEKNASKEKTHPLIAGPRITEKAAKQSEQGIYTFNVKISANKSEVKKAIKTLYNVEPVKVSITKISSKKVSRGGIVGTKSGGKKAVVHLKKGDKITFA